VYKIRVGSYLPSIPRHGLWNDGYVYLDEIRKVMATYDYLCDNGHNSTQVRAMTEEQTIFTCIEDSCNSELKRVWDAAPAIFKGRGFYKTGG
jgi:predicted nucleic acid-binding Zn ribbon protein